MGTVAAKEHAAIEMIRGLRSVMVAFSGGVDSSLVAWLAVRALPTTATAAIGVSPSLPHDELVEARGTAAEIGIPLLEVETRELDNQSYSSNPVDRCFHCKDELFTRLEGVVSARGDAVVLDGYNADDAQEVLYGRRAAVLHGVRSPLFEAGLTKAEVRTLAAQHALPTADKPAAACLASRFPTGDPITAERLHEVELAERYLRGIGLRVLRVRRQDSSARIETDDAGFRTILERREEVDAAIRGLGFTRATLDLANYRRGSTVLPILQVQPSATA